MFLRNRTMFHPGIAERKSILMDFHALPLTHSHQVRPARHRKGRRRRPDSLRTNPHITPGPLTPERHALLKAFHTIQYRWTFKVGVVVDLARDDHPQHWHCTHEHLPSASISAPAPPRWSRGMFKHTTEKLSTIPPAHWLHIGSARSSFLPPSSHEA